MDAVVPIPECTIPTTTRSSYEADPAGLRVPVSLR
jgi:hypothetical protein